MGSVRLAGWRRRRPNLRGAGSWYLAGAVSLTIVCLLAPVLAPAPGLTRSYHYPLDNPDPTVVEERITSVDLAFIDAESRPTRNYRVVWRGVWFSPREERIDFHAAADDGVIVRLDGETVIERNSQVGTGRAVRTVELDAGPHQLEIDHWQRGAERRLHLAWAPVGGEPTPLAPDRLFRENPGPAYWLLVASPGLRMLVLLAWATGFTVLLGLTAYRRASALTGQELATRVRVLLFPALLGPSQLLVFGPWTVHATNRTEFLVSFWNLAPYWLWLLVPVAGMLIALGSVLPPRWFPRYVAGLCAAGVLLWAQGNLLVADYGLLDGQGLDLAPHAWRITAEVGLWTGGIALAVIFAAAVVRTAPLASGLLLAFQTILLLLPPMESAAGLLPAGPRDRGADAGWRLPPAEVYELSGSRNLIHIVLDMFPSHVFAEIAAADRGRFDRDWSGFTFFPDHLGAFRTTKGSMPAMLTGAAYRNETPFDEFLADRASLSVFHALGRQDHQLRRISSINYDRPDRSLPGLDSLIEYDIPTPYGDHSNYLAVSAAQLLDLSLFRHAPHGMKGSIYRDQRWLLQHEVAARRQVEARAERAFGDMQFLREFAGRLTAGGAAPVYTFVHLIAPHFPVVTDATCTYLGGRVRLTAESYAAQARCALAGVQTLLDRLRVLDLYDRSAIVVTSDHGWALPGAPEENPFRGLRSPATDLARVAADATPLLLLKPVGSRGPLRTSYAPTAITDLPATLLDLAGLPNTLGRGTSALALEPAAPRERTYAQHEWGNTNKHTSPYFDVLHVFSVNGRVTDPDAWRHRRAIFDPTGDHDAQRRAHRVGLMPVDDGSAGRTGAPVHRADNYAVFYAAPDAVRITFDVRRASDTPGSRTVTVRIDGEVVGEQELVDTAWRTLAYTVEARDAPNIPFTVELLSSPVRRGAEGSGQGVMVRGHL